MSDATQTPVPIPEPVMMPRERLPATLGDRTGDRPPQDQAARDAALDVSRSWIVQAPAGAGKTELLTQRFLTLLSVVDEPEEILAITFTRAATAEMRGRILSSLEEAGRAKAVRGEPRTLALARKALAHSETRGWRLLEQPHRLDVQTIDSLCLRLAHGQPLLSRLGGRLEPTEQGAPLYALAAQRTLAVLGHAPVEVQAALEHLLLLRDNNLRDCSQLIAEMLERREQWRHVFVLSEHAPVDWEQVRARLEAPFAAEVQRVLGLLARAFAAEPTLSAELLELAQYACQNGSRDIELLAGLQTLPSPHNDFLGHWTCLRAFLLTKDGSWRRTVTLREGFPRDGNGMTRDQCTGYKQRMTRAIEQLQRDPAAGERLRRLLCSLAALPSPRYDATQWRTLLSVFRVLRRAVAELHVVFAERNQVDFAELSIAAATVLDEQENTRGLLASEARRHLLIDEFQDTSRGQHQLIGRLLQEWQPGDGRTCFLVGDPMQSIYIFRQAEVELFGRVQRRGLDCGSHAHPCAGLRLSENFRSHAGLVEPLNRHFAAIFAEPLQGPGHEPSSASEEIPFSPSTAAAPALDGKEAVHVHCFFHDTLDEAGDAAAEELARARQVARVIELVEQQLPRIESARCAAAQPGNARSYTVAILGRAKNHLIPIAAALRARGIAFRAIELESLADRQEIIDLLSILRALLRPMDRIAWLSVLRAPWCGLTLGNLHQLTGADQREFGSRAVPELIEQRATLLSAEGQVRAARVAQLMARATAAPVRSLAAWVERTWTSLGAPAYLKAEERENAETFFRLLDQLAPDGIDALDGSLDAALSLLCASPDAAASEHFGVQLMTIHKAKGLGFEVVIVPALERKPGGDKAQLVTMLARQRMQDEDDEVEEILVAPLGARGEQHRSYKWVEARRRQKEASERKRLLYVAATRARQQLHLLGTAEITSTGSLKPSGSDNLLACAWPALEPIFAERQAEWAASATLPALPQPVAAPAAPGPGSDRPLPGLVDRLAAGAAPTCGLPLSRVAANFHPVLQLENVTSAGTLLQIASPPSTPLSVLERPEGSFEQRARGNAVHAMLELVSRNWARSGSAGDPATVLPQLKRKARFELARAGIAAARVEALGASLAATVVAAAASDEGRWILAPHPDARSEWAFSAWSGSQRAEGRVQNMRVDRSFRAGDTPLAPGSDCLWIIDYKTGTGPGGLALDAWLETQKQQWHLQLEAYGQALRSLGNGSVVLRYGLYFPELQRLKTWPG